jgi:cyanamide hydratase
MSSTPAASAIEIAEHGWPAIHRDAHSIFGGKPYLYEPSPIGVEEISLPLQDPIVAKVHEFAKEHLNEAIYNHSMRVFHWGICDYLTSRGHGS